VVPSQSAGTFRAIVVQPSSPDAVSGVSDVQRSSDMPTQLGRHRRGRRIAATLAATAGLAALAAGLIFRAGALSSPGHPAAAQAPLPTLEAPLPAVEPAPKPAEAAPVPATAPAPTASAVAPTPPVSAKPRSLPAAPKKKAKKADAADLIAPDFAK
jgi:hypothetical protein